MKRIKHEDIQSAIQGYVRQRNYPASVEQAPVSSSSTAPFATASSFTTDIDLMALNDLSLIESTLNDYYTFSFSAPAERDLIGQFETLRGLVSGLGSPELDQLIFPIAVHVCIELSQLGAPVKAFLSKFTGETEPIPELKRNAGLVESLLAYGQQRDLAACPLVNEWIRNKFQVRLSAAAWKRFLGLLRSANVHLMLRIVNLHLQIVTSDAPVAGLAESGGREEPRIAPGRGSEPAEFVTSSSNFSQPSAKVKDEDQDGLLTSTNLMGHSDARRPTLKSLNEAIQKIGAQPSRINGACYYFLDDAGDSLTSVSISPNLEMLAASTENSSVLLYKLHEGDFRKPTLASRHQQRKCRLSASSARKAKLNSSHFINNNLSSSSGEKTATGGGEDESRGREQQRPGARLSKLFADCLGGGGATTDSNYVQELLGGHAGVVLKAKFTHDSKYLLSCGDDGQASLWSVSRALRDLQPAAGSAGESFETGDSTAAATTTDTTGAGATETTSSEFDFDSFESRIRAGRDEDEDEEASFSTAAHVCTYSGHLYPVWDLELFSRLNLFATCSKDNTARLWSFDRLCPLRVYCGHQSDVNCIRFHPNGAYMATGSSDKTVRLWSVRSGDFVRLFSGHRSRVFSLAFSPDGLYLASAGEDKKIKVWDLRTGQLYKELKGHTDIIHSVEFDRQSEVLCSAGLDKTVKFWDVHQRNVVCLTAAAGTNRASEGALISTAQSAGKRASLKGNRAPSSTPGASAELIRSIGVESAVYSAYCDEQNIFYLLGARKPGPAVVAEQQPSLHAVDTYLPYSYDDSALPSSRSSSVGASKYARHSLYAGSYRSSDLVSSSGLMADYASSAPPVSSSLYMGGGGGGGGNGGGGLEQAQALSRSNPRRRTSSALNSTNASVTLAAANMGLYDWNEPN